jgi:ABC-type branched-subunit amino acid transport system substrate-binding protein
LLIYAKHRERALTLVAGAIALVVAVSACGSTSSSTSSASSASTSASSTAGAASSPKGSPVTVLVTAPVNSPAVSLPQWFDISEIYAKQMNAAGGLDGHPVKIVTCDNQLSPTETVSCARKAGAVGAVAEVGFALGTSAMMQVLQSEHIPWIPGDAATPIELQSPISFPPTLTALYQASGQVALAIKDKCKSVALFVPSTLVAQAPIQKQQLAVNGIPSSVVVVPVTSTDVSPYLAQTSGKTCLILSGVSDQIIAQLGVALPQLGAKFQHVIADPSLTTALATKAPTAWNGTQIASVITDISAPAWSTYRQGISQYATLSQTKFPYSEGQGNYAAMNLLGNVVESIAKRGDTINSTSVLAALNSNTTWSTDGVTPSVNFTVKLGVPNSPRLASPYAGFSEVNSSGQVTGAFDNQYVSILDLLLGKKVSGGFFG